MNLIEQFARNLEFLNLGTVADKEKSGDIFWGTMPDKPDECVCVFSTDSRIGGDDDGARIQVMVRGRSDRKAYERSQAIAEAIADFTGYLAGDGARATIEIINTSAGLGVDDRHRVLYSSNYRVFYCNY